MAEQVNLPEPQTRLTRLTQIDPEQSRRSRLKVRFWQDGVQLPRAPTPRRQIIDFGINYCSDGLPPKSLN